MASISVKGASKTRGLLKDIKDISNFCLHRLMQDRLANKISVDFVISKEICDSEEFMGGEGTLGDCEWMDDAYSPKEFTIRIATYALKSGKKKPIKLKKREILETVCHELVHVKQHAKNELQTGHAVAARGGLKIYSKWMGQIWKPKGKEDHYFDAPWEIEAYGREVGLNHKWLAAQGAK